MNLESAKQNHPELIVDQLLDQYSNLSKKTIRHILKFTGVNKWLKNRRYIIQLKERWKKDITDLQKKTDSYRHKMNSSTGIEFHKYELLYHKSKTRMQTLMDCRQQVRTICHSCRETNFPEDTTSFRDIGNLPDNFPIRPPTKFLKRKGL